MEISSDPGFPSLSQNYPVVEQGHAFLTPIKVQHFLGRVAELEGTTGWLVSNSL
jgi:hypothetical protein